MTKKLSLAVARPPGVTVPTLSKTAVADAWTEWLAHRPWDLFVTFTAVRSHPEALHKRFRYCMHKLADDLYGRCRGYSPIEWVNGIERHKSGMPHSHALVRLPGCDVMDYDQFPRKYWADFFTATGGTNPDTGKPLGRVKLEVPFAQADVVAYVTKYVTKDGDLEFSPNLSPVLDRTPQLELVRAAASADPQRA